ncbi:MAG: trehalose-phosphatase [Acidobacteriota bacterium]|nr:MAG: trehalose-phosphatase [Acidobacteriota bacterium]
MRKTADFEAAILDLDGVITKTATIHARAWKKMFDEYLELRHKRNGDEQPPFDIGKDYRRYVDGKPRYDGVRSFLSSRGIEIPEGTPHDSPETESICGLGNRKNALFQQVLERDGAEVFDDAVEQNNAWRRAGLKTAVVSSSRNCRPILETAGLIDDFDAIVDGVDQQRLGFDGEPAPDVFLEAAKRLGVAPRAAIVVEDAESGVAAGRAGGFGLVVGVVRAGGEPARRALRDHGADLVVGDLRQIDDALDRRGRRLYLVDEMERLHEALAGRRPALFLDYDCTLTPIVDRPELATLSEPMRNALRDTARRMTVAIVSGRDLADVRQLVGLDELVYAGSHGFDIAGPAGLRREYERAERALPELDAAEQALLEHLESIKGCLVERKRFAIAIHYRLVDPIDVPQIEQTVDEIHARYRNLRKKGGKMIFELQPDVEWDKGRAVLWLLSELELDRDDVLPIYVGDDVTDEDAFAALETHGLGIRVGRPDEPTRAQFLLREPEEVTSLLDALRAGASPV